MTLKMYHKGRKCFITGIIKDDVQIEITFRKMFNFINSRNASASRDKILFPINRTAKRKHTDSIRCDKDIGSWCLLCFWWENIDVTSMLEDTWTAFYGESHAYPVFQQFHFLLH